jgi:hypothetical protein
MSNMDALSAPAVQMIHACVSILRESSKKFCVIDGKTVFWTKAGLVVVQEDPYSVYLLHNNGTIFKVNYVFRKQYHPDIKILSVKKSWKFVPTDWSTSLFDMSFALATRAHTEDTHVPDITKLNTLAEKMFNQVVISEEDSWLTC